MTTELEAKIIVFDLWIITIFISFPRAGLKMLKITKTNMGMMSEI